MRLFNAAETAKAVAERVREERHERALRRGAAEERSRMLGESERVRLRSAKDDSERGRVGENTTGEPGSGGYLLATFPTWTTRGTIDEGRIKAATSEGFRILLGAVRIILHVYLDVAWTDANGRDAEGKNPPTKRKATRQTQGKSRTATDAAETTTSLASAAAASSATTTTTTTRTSSSKTTGTGGSRNNAGVAPGSSQTQSQKSKSKRAGKKDGGESSNLVTLPESAADKIA